MKTKDYLVTILLGIAIIFLGIGQLINIKEQKLQYKILSDKIDAVALQSDANIADIHSRMDALEIQINDVSEKNNDAITNIKKDLKTQVDKLNEKIEKEQQTTTEEEQQEGSKEQQQTKVGAINIIKDEHATMTEIDDEQVVTEPVPSGSHLTPEAGVFWFGNQLETYYNLDMSVIVEVAHQNGIGGEYWVRDDGCKMLGDYIMLACNRDVHPYGSIVQTSLGAGISLDTGGFAASNPYQVDIAVTW